MNKRLLAAYILKWLSLGFFLVGIGQLVIGSMKSYFGGWASSQQQEPVSWFDRVGSLGRGLFTWVAISIVIGIILFVVGNIWARSIEKK